MNIERVNNDIVKLTSDNGIIDIRTNKIYSEVIINPKYIKYFKDYTSEVDKKYSNN